MEKSPATREVSIFDPITGQVTGTTKLPSVFLAPVRTDLIHFVHTNMAKNHRQPYGVKSHHGPHGISAGHQNSAHSWGTGRAVSRIPRIGGSGSHASGQGAIGNMCRGGHMYAPTKVWRRWHRKINKNQRRYATASALAASAVSSFVTARGHRIDKVPEIPLVVDSSTESYRKTKQAVALLKAVGGYEDVAKVINAKTLRAGKGKMRGRRYAIRKGPLVVYHKDDGIVRAFRNIPGVDLCSVERLNLLQLAPGSHSGRFIIWTKSAFDVLDNIFGTFEEQSLVKRGFVLPRYNIMTDSDLARVINSDAIQNALRPAIEKPTKQKKLKKNPLKKKNFMELIKLNPFAESSVKIELVKDEIVMADE